MLRVLDRHTEALCRGGRVRARVHSVASDAPQFVRPAGPPARLPPLSRCVLHIPYCGETLLWTVIYDPLRPNDPPDIVFGENDADFARHLVMKGCPSSLSEEEWNADEDESLHRAVLQLLDEYAKFSARALPGALDDDRLTLEYEALQADPATNHSFLAPSPRELCCTIPIAADFSQLPAKLSGTPQVFARLRSKLSPKITIQNLPACVKGVKLPTWTAKATLAEFYPLLNTAIEQEVARAVLRLQLITRLCEIIPGMLECDVETLQSVSFLYEYGGQSGNAGVYPFVVKVALDGDFPKQPPGITLVSVFHSRDYKPYCSTIKRFPYSPGWDLEKMACSLRESISKSITQFYKLCSGK